MSGTERVRVVAEHHPPSTPPIEIRSGDTVEVGERDDEWPAFVRVRTKSGGTGWVPSRNLSTDRGMAVVRQGYNTRELDGRPGDELTVLEHDDDGGWLWCRNDEGLEGWIPLRVLRAQ